MNKTHFHVKGFALGLALKQRQKATWKSPIIFKCSEFYFYFFLIVELFLFAQQDKLLKNCTQELAGKNVSKIGTAITLPMLQYPHRTLLMCRQMCFASAYGVLR